MSKCVATFRRKGETRESRILFEISRHICSYAVALVSSIDKIIGLFCKRAQEKRLYSAKETCNLIEPTNRSHSFARVTSSPASRV